MNQKNIELDLDSRRLVMAIVNVTPDSFFAESRTVQVDDIIRRVRDAVEEGCDIIDVGGYSSRPNAVDVTPEEEWRRVKLGIECVRSVSDDIIISLDTFRSRTARKALDMFGPLIINDITAGEADEQIWSVVAQYDVPYVAMHMRGMPATMQSMTSYDDGVVAEIISYFNERIPLMKAAGVRQIILDPGFGFAKTVAQNFELLRDLHKLRELGYPVLAGVSRKSMIYKTLDTTPDKALAGSSVLGWECLRQGADILRVHDTQEATDTIKLFNAYRHE